MKRREFIFAVGGAAVTWPLSAQAQQTDRARRIGVLMNNDGADQRASYAAFMQFLKELGWADGGNLRVDSRWADGSASDIRKYAEELAALAPDVIVVTGTAGLAPIIQVAPTVPIVFANVADPVGAGFVNSMSRPGGNVTGFVQFEYSLSAKWLELLKQVAPDLARVAVLRDPAITSGIGQFAVIQSVATSIGVEVVAINVRDASEIEQSVEAFARFPNGGLILTASALATTHRNLIIALAAKYKLPAVYYRRYYAASGGLISYGYDVFQQYRGAAGYVDRILKGEKPANLPVQAPTKYELIINLKTAKAMGLTVPPALLARADEVIE
jgi:putative ABC transport system substrate-binding protein